MLIVDAVPYWMIIVPEMPQKGPKKFFVELAQHANMSHDHS